MSYYDDEINDLFRGNNRILAVKLIDMVNNFRSYWPMTLRGFYYQAVSALLVKNNINEYRRISKIMAKLRREDLMPWRAMEDKTRTTSGKRGVRDVSIFIENELDGFMDPESYGRCYIQDQEVYVEVSVEKDALYNLVRKSAYAFCTRVNVARGQSSATLLNDMAERFDRAIMQGKEAILLHFGDLDPTGVQIPLSLENGFSEHHDIMVDVRQMALTPEQCIEHNLPQSLDAAKQNDPNIRRWYQRFGDQSPTELDALHPEVLMGIVKKSLDGVYDMSGVDAQKEKEQEEREILLEMRNDTINHFCEEWPDVMREAGYL